ncbi:hypothetical protein A2Y99_03715 [Candidatus Gottesmanbacteria bacterium RBG_13_37_7]|uniref:dTDP-4-dehydrorhamnose reductase n=1 Tax=Candidatus Gottesmanbacteria bacterium RBG_13_37_7 TaxID=1798369 RepID=A0A1F5YKN9_9BACT|nr:MAG: hypothetical protein A2Y99_03715 [Candidatus Gottesmanbacteria bacterium RBG_13_37_7]
MKIPILTTGCSGLVGSRVADILQHKYLFEDLSLATGINITHLDELEKHIASSRADVILHMAAKTDVDSCEDDKAYGEEGAAWMVNVVGTENVVNCAEKFNKRVIYISTDFVFDGNKEYFSESDLPNPVNWYGETKLEGENIVLNSGNASIIRIAYPYKKDVLEKKDFVHRIWDNIVLGKQIFGVSDHVITPTFIDDIALVLDIFLERKLTGIFHAVGGESLTAYEAADNIGKVFGKKAKIKAITRSEYFQGRAFRPFKLALKNDKIRQLGIRMKTFSEGLEIIKETVK